MKIIKTFILSVMCMMIGLMIVDFGANNCKAANISDKTWSFALSLTNTVRQFVQKEAKDNDSYIYVKWSSTNGGNLSKISVAPYGYRGTSRFFAGTRAEQDREYIVPHTGAYFLTNYVNECGGDAAVVSFRGYVGYGNAVGKWSPDSIGSYTVLSQLR